MLNGGGGMGYIFDNEIADVASIVWGFRWTIRKEPVMQAGVTQKHPHHPSQIGDTFPTPITPFDHIDLSLVSSNFIFQHGTL